MKLKHTITMATIGLLAVGASAPAHAADSEPVATRTSETLVATSGGQSAAATTTCEGLVSCWILEVGCDAAGGYYSEWTDPDQRDGNHTHGMCSTN
jgi:hypothetical protein